MDLLAQLFGSAAAGLKRHPEGLTGLVVLSNTHVPLTVESLRNTLDSLYPGQFQSSEEAGNKVSKGFLQGMFGIECVIPGAQGWYLLHSNLGPYTAFSDFGEHIDDEELRDVAEAQEFSLEMHLVSIHGIQEEAYRFIGAVLAVLAPADSAILVHPSNHAVIAFTPAVRKCLAAGDAAHGTS